MPTLQQVKGIIQFLDGVQSPLLSLSEVGELPKIIGENERIERIARGSYGNGTGLLVATDRRLIFVDKGFFSKLKVEDFPYDRITSIHYETGIALGALKLFASGSTAEIKNLGKEKARSFAEYVRDKLAIASNHSDRRREETSTRVDDAVSKLERLGALKMKGLLTDEEFQDQKQKLLNAVPKSESLEEAEESPPVAADQLTPKIIDEVSPAANYYSFASLRSPQASFVTKHRRLLVLGVFALIVLYGKTLLESASTATVSPQRIADSAQTTGAAESASLPTRPAQRIACDQETARSVQAKIAVMADRKDDSDEVTYTWKADWYDAIEEKIPALVQAAADADACASGRARMMFFYKSTGQLVATVSPSSGVKIVR